MTTSDMSTSELDDNPIEVRISLDMVKRGIYVAPLIIAVAAMPWGGPGASSAWVRRAYPATMRPRRAPCRAVRAPR